MTVQESINNLQFIVDKNHIDLAIKRGQRAKVLLWVSPNASELKTNRGREYALQLLKDNK